MRYLAHYTLFLIAAVSPGAVSGQAGLSFDRTSGVGLKVQPAGAPYSADESFGTVAAHAWHGMSANDYSLYGGEREAPLLGLRPAESYVGIVHSGGGWGSSLELGYVEASMLAPRRYALTSQLHTSLSEGKTLSVGLKYRVYDPDSAARFGMPGELPGNGYTLAGAWSAGYAPSYQVQMSYQYSAASAFGMALGRDVETFTPFVDPSMSGPRQLSFTGQHWLTPSWALSYDVLSQDVTSPLKLQGLRLGVRYRW